MAYREATSPLSYAAAPRSYAAAPPPPPMSSHPCPIHFPHLQPPPPPSCTCHIHNPNPNPDPWCDAPPPHSTVDFDPYLHGGYGGQYASPYQPPPPPAPGAPYYEDAATWYGEYPDPFDHEHAQQAPCACHLGYTPQYGEYANRKPIKNVGRRATTEDLNMKKRKAIAGGAKVESLRICTICNVVCINDKAFASHLAGEKHALMGLGGKPTRPVQEGRIIKTFRCDVCNVDCTNADDLSEHKKGKKHMTKLLKLQASITMPSTVTFTGNGSQEAEGEQLRKESKPEGEQPMKTVKEEDKQPRKRVKPTPPVQEGRVITNFPCDACNVDCTNPDDLRKHNKGKTHTANLLKLQASITMPSTVTFAGNGSQEAEGEQPRTRDEQPRTREDMEEKKRNLLENGSTANNVRECTLCNVVCNSRRAYVAHMSGKKHAAANGSQEAEGEQPWTSDEQPRTREDMEEKKRNLLENGSTANNVLECTLCNVVCNSHRAYVAHMSGKKHAAANGSQEFEGEQPRKRAKSEGEQPRKRAKAEGERPKKRKDVEGKKQNLLENGSAANNVWECTLCNVVCNSHTAFVDHTTGMKHSVKAMKQQQALPS